MTSHGRFEALYVSESARILRYARYRVGADLAEDVVAETFAVAWRKIASVPDPPHPWLLATARRVSANQLRARRSEQARSTALADLDIPVADTNGRFEARHDLVQALKRLPPLDREAVLLVTWYDLSNKEAARVMDCSAAAFNVRLHRARRRLARVLGTGDDATHPNTHDRLDRPS